MKRNLNHKAAVIVALLAVTALIAAIVFTAYSKNKECLPPSFHYGSVIVIIGGLFYALWSSIKLTLHKNGQTRNNQSNSSKVT
jgi:glucose uptake protein GlcU